MAAPPSRSAVFQMDPQEEAAPASSSCRKQAGPKTPHGSRMRFQLPYNRETVLLECAPNRQEATSRCVTEILRAQKILEFERLVGTGRLCYFLGGFHSSISKLCPEANAIMSYETQVCDHTL